MHIITPRGHLPLRHLIRGFQVFEVRIVAMKRYVNAFLHYVVTPYPPFRRGVLVMRLYEHVHGAKSAQNFKSRAQS